MRGQRHRLLGKKCRAGRLKGYQRLGGIRLSVLGRKGGMSGDEHSCADADNARRGRRA